MDRKKIKKYSVVILKICIAMVLVWYLFKSDRLTKETFVKLLNPEFLPFLVFSAFAFLIAQMLSSIRIIFLLRIIDITLNFNRAFKLTMVGNFFNMVIPGMVGGDIVKVFYLTKNEESYKGRSSGIVIVDRVIGLFALLIIGTFSIAYLLWQENPNLNTYQYELHGIMTFSIVVIGLFALFIIFAKNELLRKRLKEIAFKIFRESFFYHMIEGLGAVTKKRRYLIYAFLISIMIQGISLAGLLILINLTSEAIPNIITLVAVSSLVMLLGVVPVTPGNIGWTELMATFGWSIVGSNYGAEIFFHWRIVTLLCSLSGGVFYLTPRIVEK